ncbi:hypothetical protein C0J52_14165 [Blattella germanica]|nr:hypothetical protein C0J52_14165 [Blattella germanica]
MNQTVEEDNCRNNGNGEINWIVTHVVTLMWAPARNTRKQQRRRIPLRHIVASDEFSVQGAPLRRHQAIDWHKKAPERRSHHHHPPVSTEIDFHTMKEALPSDLYLFQFGIMASLALIILSTIAGYVRKALFVSAMVCKEYNKYFDTNFSNQNFCYWCQDYVRELLEVTTHSAKITVHVNFDVMVPLHLGILHLPAQRQIPQQDQDHQQHLQRAALSLCKGKSSAPSKELSLQSSSE